MLMRNTNTHADEEHRVLHKLMRDTGNTVLHILMRNTGIHAHTLMRNTGNTVLHMLMRNTGNTHVHTDEEHREYTH